MKIENFSTRLTLDNLFCAGGLATSPSLLVASLCRVPLIEIQTVSELALKTPCLLSAEPPHLLSLLSLTTTLSKALYQPRFPTLNFHSIPSTFRD